MGPISALLKRGCGHAPVFGLALSEFGLLFAIGQLMEMLCIFYLIDCIIKIVEVKKRKT